jgi:gamma-butyrobetaine hydroxylase
MNSGNIISQVTVEKKRMVIYWSDNSRSSYPFLYLRDNCDSFQCRHPNGQKLIETHEIDPDIYPLSWHVSEDGTNLTICWSQDNHTSEFNSSWLKAHTLSKADHEHKSRQASILWDQHLQVNLPEKDFLLFEKSKDELVSWIRCIAYFGFGILHNVPAEPDYLPEIIRLFGFIRETNYGRLFNVKTVANPNNLAYSNLAISPHTDNPYRHPIPSLQILHCVRSNTKGGDTILVDGFNIANAMRKNWPSYFHQLTSVGLTYRFRDKHTWLENSTPVISLDLQGKVKSIAYNNRSVCPFDLDDEEIDQFYEAYQAFGRMTNDPEYQIRFRMEPGDLYVVNNERILHARTAFEECHGERWLQGAYADIDSLLSRLAIYESNQKSVSGAPASRKI